MSPRKLAFALFFGAAAGLATSAAWASGYTSLNAGIAAENEARFDDAIALLTTAIASPDLPPALLPVAHVDRAIALMSKSEFAEAVKDCDAALQLRPDWYVAFEICGAASGGNGDRTAAVTRFSAAIALKPSNPSAYAMRAFAYANQDRFDDAIADDNKAIALEPDSAEGYLDRAAAYDMEGRFDLALADWTKGDDIKPDDYRIQRAMGVDHWAIGEYGDAASDFARARRLEPDSLYSQIWLDIVELAKDSSVKPDRLSLSDAQLAAWPGPILKFYAGSSQPADVMAAATSGGDPGNGQTCEADFYVGEWQKLHNLADDAKTHFDHAVKICPHAFVEYMTASLELRHMRGSP